MRILWASDSPAWPTSFGNITRAVCAGLAESGHEVSVMGGDRCRRPLHRRHFTILPGNGRDLAAPVLQRHLEKLQPDVLVTLLSTGDLTAVPVQALNRIRRAAPAVWVFYHPNHFDRRDGRLPREVRRRIKSMDVSVVMSRHGLNLLRANGVSAVYIPVGVDTRIFRPPEAKRTAKRLLGYNNRFVVLCDARNHVLKLLPRTLDVFRRFAAGKRDVLLHLHCDPFDPERLPDEYSYNIARDVELVGLADKVRFTRRMSINRGLPLERLAALYQAADVHLLTSCVEGFGMPTLQASASGVVPLAPDCGANREMVKGHGEPIRVRQFVPTHWPLSCAVVDIDDAVAKLNRLYEDRALLASKAAAARRFAEPYDWDRVVARWRDLLENRVASATAATRRRRAARARFKSPSGHAASNRPPGSRFSIPATLPPADPSLASVRVMGRICLASPADIPVFEVLRRVFPCVSAWSPTVSGWKVSRTRSFPCRKVSAGTALFRRYLAASTLVLDVGGTGTVSPGLAALFSVPLAGSSRVPNQRALWPDLTLKTGDVGIAAATARGILTDHARAAAVCALARTRYNRRRLRL